MNDFCFKFSGQFSGIFFGNFINKILVIQVSTLILASLSYGALNPEHKNAILDQAIDPFSSILISKGLDPEKFEAYVGDDKGVYAYSDELFCMYSESDAFTINDSITFGLASFIRDKLSIPRGRVQCLSVTTNKD